MKILRMSLIMVLACSCRKIGDNPTPGKVEDTMERREEVRKIISGYIHHPGVDVVRGPLTVKEVQDELTEAIARTHPGGGRRMLPGGPEWEQLKVRLKKGDEIYFYDTDPKSWSELRGQQGYVALRGNDVLGSLLTEVN